MLVLVLCGGQLVQGVAAEMLQPRLLSPDAVRMAQDCSVQLARVRAQGAVQQKRLELREAINALLAATLCEVKDSGKAAAVSQKYLTEQALQHVNHALQDVVQEVGAHVKAVLDLELRVQQHAAESMESFKGLLPSCVGEATLAHSLEPRGPCTHWHDHHDPRLSHCRSR